MNTHYFIPICIVLLFFVGVGISLSVYADSNVDKSWKNNTRNIYLGHWTNPIWILYFDSVSYKHYAMYDCDLEDGRIIDYYFELPVGEQKVWWFTSPSDADRVDVSEYSYYELADKIIEECKSQNFAKVSGQ